MRTSHQDFIWIIIINKFKTICGRIQSGVAKTRNGSGSPDCAKSLNFVQSRMSLKVVQMSLTLHWQERQEIQPENLAGNCEVFLCSGSTKKNTHWMDRLFDNKEEICLQQQN